LNTRREIGALLGKCALLGEHHADAQRFIGSRRANVWGRQRERATGQHRAGISQKAPPRQR
jgi:hypothetical protein